MKLDSSRKIYQYIDVIFGLFIIIRIFSAKLDESRF